MLLDGEAITALLPHRTPLLLTDSVIVDEPGVSGVGRVRLPVNDRLWDDWTGAKLTDELILEGAAQVLGVVMSTGTARPNSATQNQRLLLSFDTVEFHCMADPHTEISVVVRVEVRFGAMSIGNFSASQKGELVAAGRIGVMGG